MTQEQILINLISGAVGALLIWLLQWFRESRKQRYERRLYILRNIMANIQNVVSHDFVSAFNLIMLEYKASSSVIKYHSKFIELVNLTATKDKKESEKRNKNFNDNLVKLIEEVAKSINIRIEQLDIYNKVYWPIGFSNTAQQQQKLAELLIKNCENWDGKFFSKIEKGDIKLTFDKNRSKKNGQK